DDCDASTPLGDEFWHVFPGTAATFMETARELRLPSGFGDQPGAGLLSDGACDAEGDVLHVVTDMDGDGRPDLLTTSDCDAGSVFGAEHWRVHRQADDAFAAEGTELPLPACFGAQPFSGVWIDQTAC